MHVIDPRDGLQAWISLVNIYRPSVGHEVNGLLPLPQQQTIMK